MKRKVYLSLLSMGLACMAVTLLISTWFFWRSTQHQIQQELTMTMDVVETALEEGHDTSLYLKKIGIHHTNGLRITWINARGDVLFESDYDKGIMENHLARPEVRAAIEMGKGQPSAIPRPCLRPSIIMPRNFLMGPSCGSAWKGIRFMLTSSASCRGPSCSWDCRPWPVSRPRAC